MSEINPVNAWDVNITVPRQRTSATGFELNLSRHELIEQLGIGGMGEVYRSRDAALERDLAIKVLKAELRGDAAAEQRFVREARITGMLQHPGIVPIHHLGRLTDGRLCYTMKLVRGRTLADMLKDNDAGTERLPRLLVIFEKICQAISYAHSKDVIHRDLKPANVMVGEFGEVQVMDWGLAKELHAGAEIRESPGAPPMTEGRTDEWLAEAASLSRAGAAMGTLAYMPPEQAAGDWPLVDERADVFALGAMLCEMLTGQPPYQGANREEVLPRVRRGDLSEALARLQHCGADAALLALCRECLAAEREERPRQASVVAERLAAYQTAVQERLRLAELERARAEGKAGEERKRRRLTAAVAALLLLLVMGIGGGFWWKQWKQKRDDGTVDTALGQVELLERQAQADPLHTDKFRQALEAARAAGTLAEGASEGPQRRAAELIARLEREEAAAVKDRELLTALLDVRGPREGPKYQSDAKRALMALAEPTADEQFAAAFRRWGVDVDRTAADEAAALLKARPALVVTEVIAALVEWASERRRQGKAKVDGQGPTELAALLDDDPGSKRRELRAILARDQLPLERALSVLSAALRPVPIPVQVPLGPDCLRLRQLAEQTDAAAEPILSLLTLVRALAVAGEESQAEQLLRAAIVARPQEVVLHHTLGQLLMTQRPPRWAEAVECYAAARVRRPDLGVNLATALLRSGRDREGLALLARLVAQTPNNPYLHFQRAYALADKGGLDEALDEYRQAIVLDPKLAAAHNNLGNALRAKGRVDEALAELRQAIELDPKYAAAHYNLGNVLYAKGRADEALAAYRQAIALDLQNALVHYNLGVVLYVKGRVDEAICAYRQAIALDPKNAAAHNNLGSALRAKGRVDEALAAYRQAIALDPKYAMAHNNLGVALADKQQLQEAMDEYRQAIALDPKNVLAHYNLGNALRAKGDLDEALAAYRQAIALDPKNAQAHHARGITLFQQGRYARARESIQQALELLPREAPLRRIVLQQLQQCEGMLALDKKLPAILTGEVTPANSSEAISLAALCQQHKKQHIAAARLYADAFTAEPKLAADLNQQHRYNAACSAARVAAQQGASAPPLPDKVAGMFRRWALGWLRDDLKTYVRLAEQNNPQMKQTIQQRLTHWQRDADLASIRDPQALDRLPENERAAWQTLWHDVEELVQRTAGK